MSLTVAVVGASHKPQRYSFRAMSMLAEYGHQAIPVSRNGNDIQNQPGFRALSEIPETVRDSLDTVTMYVRAELQSDVISEILQIKPRRVIFNPGTENPAEYTKLEQAGIKVQEACTLVLLSTHQFET